MSNRARPSVATHSIRYVIANVLVMLAGFVSFPIMTRLLDTRQYGIFGYYDAWLMILLGIFKLGGQHTILRFYPHVGGEVALPRYGANFVLAPFLTACLLWLLALAVYLAITYIAPPEAADIGWFMLLLLPVNIWISYANAVAFATEHSEVSVRLSVGQRWLEAAMILGIVYFLLRNALGVYIGRLIIGLVFACISWIWVRRRVPTHLRDFDAKEFLRGLRYGLPLVVNEIAAISLAFVDRVMLRVMLNDFTAVGVYTIGYGLALNIATLLNTAILSAYTQVSVREFETQGPAAVVRTKKVLLRVFIYLSVVFITGLFAVGGDALLLLAGNDKIASVPVFVLIGVNYVLDGIFKICSTGLLLHKRSTTVLTLTLGSLAMNIVLNLFWIPQFGLLGAVYATLASYLALNLAQYFFCPRDLRALPSLHATCTAIGLGALTWSMAHYTNLFGVSSHLGRLAMMALLTLVLYVGPAFALDRRLRESVVGYWRTRRSLPN